MIITFILLFIITARIYVISSPRNIICRYQGIKFYNKKFKYTEFYNKQIQSKIVIDGKLKANLLKSESSFSGEITVGDIVLKIDNSPIVFNKIGEASLMPYYHGVVFMKDNFKFISIQLFENIGNDIYQSDGWIITAPCNDRTEAVNITNNLMIKLGKSQLVK